MCIGASTGGVIALQELLALLPTDFAACVVVVQHHPAGLTSTVVKQLQRAAQMPVREACAADKLAVGQAWVAPGDCLFALDDDGGVLLGRDEQRLMPPDKQPLRPSIDAAMWSVARVFRQQALAVVLSGMGDDGARGVQAIKRNGGKVLIQETGSCVVGSMPEQARLATTVDHVATVREMAMWLQIYTGKN